MATRTIDVSKGYKLKDKYMVINSILQTKDVEPKLSEDIIAQLIDSLNLSDDEFIKYGHECWENLGEWASENRVIIRWIS